MTPKHHTCRQYEHPLTSHPTHTCAVFSEASAREPSPSLNNISDVIFYCSVGERSRALALLHAALVFRFHLSTYSAAARSVFSPREISVVCEETSLADLVEFGKASEENEDCDDGDCDDDCEMDSGDVSDGRT